MKKTIVFIFLTFFAYRFAQSQDVPHMQDTLSKLMEENIITKSDTAYAIWEQTVTDLLTQLKNKGRPHVAQKFETQFNQKKYERTIALLKRGAKKQIEDLEKQLAMALKQIATLTAQQNALQKNLDQLEKEVRESIVLYVQQRQKLLDEKQQLLDTLKALQEQMRQEQEKAILAQQKQLQEMNTIKESIGTMTDISENEKTQQLQEMKQLETLLKTKLAELEKEKNENQQIQAQLRKVEKAVREQQAKIKILVSTVEMLEKEKVEAQLQLQQAQAQLQKNNTLQETIKAKLAEARHELLTRKTVLEATMEKLEKKRKELEDAAEKNEQLEKKLQEQRAQLILEKSKIQQQPYSSQEKDTLLDTIDQLNEQLKNQQQGMALQKGKNDKLLQELELLATMLEEQRALEKQLRDEINKVKTRMSAKFDELDKAIKKEQEEKKKLEERIEKLKAQKQKLQKQLKEIRDQKSQTTKEGEYRNLIDQITDQMKNQSKIGQIIFSQELATIQQIEDTINNEPETIQTALTPAVNRLKIQLYSYQAEAARQALQSADNNITNLKDEKLFINKTKTFYEMIRDKQINAGEMNHFIDNSLAPIIKSLLTELMVTTQLGATGIQSALKERQENKKLAPELETVLRAVIQQANDIIITLEKIYWYELLENIKKLKLNEQDQARGALIQLGSYISQIPPIFAKLNLITQKSATLLANKFTADIPTTITK